MIAISAAIAAERKEPTIVSLVASMVTAEPPASGATAVTCGDEPAQAAALLRASGFGHDLDARLPVRQHPVAGQVRRDASAT